MSDHPLTWVDVFTSTPLAGNALAVVHDADGLDDATMLAFARETNLSETTFVQTASDAEYRNRIFWPNGELDFAGHPTLGTAVAVAYRRGDAEASYVQRTRAGLQPIDVRLDGRSATASMLQNAASWHDEVDVAATFAAVGLEPDLAVPGLPAQVISTGQRHLIVVVADAGALARVKPDAEALDPLLGPSVIYLAAVDTVAGTARARSFFVQDGVAREDPATGSAAGPLMAHVHAATGCSSLRVEQGVEMGRPSVLDCAIEADRVRVGGGVVVVAAGTVGL